MNADPVLSPKQKRLRAAQKNQTLLLTSLLTFTLGIFVGYMIWGGGTAPAPAAPAADDGQLPRTSRYDIPTEGYPSTGPADAPITIVEFSDFECPFCTKWHREVYTPLMEQYPGQVRLVYRNFPLTGLHQNAYPAAEAALCAGNQGAYWEYHDKLFQALYGLGSDAFQQYASELSLDMDAFNECVNSHKYQPFVQDDIDFALSIGVQSTPTFFINGLPVVGAQPIQAFQQVIERELNGDNAN
jgi:protein-disulfide isomerase